MLALQGPDSQKFLQKLYPDILKLKYYENLLPDSEKVVVARTGYSGELGFEIYAPNSKIVEIWNDLLSLATKALHLILLY